MKSCSHPEMKDSSACSRCHFQQARLSSQRLCQRIPVSPRESTRAKLLESLFLVRISHVVSVETVDIAADNGCCLEWDAMLFESSMLFVNDTAGAYELHGSDCVLSLYQLYDKARASAAAMRGTNKYF